MTDRQAGFKLPVRWLLTGFFASTAALFAAHGAKSADSPVPDFPSARAAWDLRGDPIERILARRVDVSLVDVPWLKAIETLAAENGLPIQLDPVLGPQDLNLNQTVTRVTRGTRLKTVIRDVLRDADMVYSVRDRRVVLTTLERGQKQQESFRSSGAAIRSGTLSTSVFRRPNYDACYSEWPSNPVT